MEKQIATLYQKASKSSKLILGLMSGTSMDGLDIALCRFEGYGRTTKVELLNFATATYTDEFKQQLRAIFSKKQVDLELLCLMNEQVARVHANLVLSTLQQWAYQPNQIDFIASHGQTIYHAPKSLHGRANLPNGTLQIGDGDHLAVLTGIITLSDFRQKHVAGGGEGAPLVLYGDYLLFSKPGENRLMLNIGGIANFTYLPANLETEKVFASDLGPGNTLMDQYVQQHFQPLYFDVDAGIASKGTCNEQLLSALLQHEFFSADFPKTTGPELFGMEYLLQAQQKSNTQLLAPADVLATLCHFTAEAIAQSVKRLSAENLIIYQSGGGLHNPLLQTLLKAKLPQAKFRAMKDLGYNPDAKEAMLFALLANETLSGQGVKLGQGNSAPALSMGKISLPK